jgi:hypothetical protein
LFDSFSSVVLALAPVVVSCFIRAVGSMVGFGLSFVPHISLHHSTGSSMEVGVVDMSENAPIFYQGSYWYPGSTMYLMLRQSAFANGVMNNVLASYNAMSGYALTLLPSNIPPEMQDTIQESASSGQLPDLTGSLSGGGALPINAISVNADGTVTVPIGSVVSILLPGHSKPIKYMLIKQITLLTLQKEVTRLKSLARRRPRKGKPAGALEKKVDALIMSLAGK